jgi:phosphoribosyl-AMP cyclohydrolase
MAIGRALPTPASDWLSPRLSVERVEEGLLLAPKFDEAGLIPVIAADARTGDVLMVGFMNREALERTLATGEMHYWSRSRGALWRKGETSGLVQRVVEILVDDDQDALLARVEVAGAGASCHVGYRSCFYRRVVALGPDAPRPAALAFTEEAKTFDPQAVYGDGPNPTVL